jgi:ABC-type transporter Mla subunit MlaD
MDKSLKFLIGLSGLLLFLVCGILGFFILSDRSNDFSETELYKKADIFNKTARYSENAAPTATNEPLQTTTTPDSSPAKPQTLPSSGDEDPVSEILASSEEDFATTVNHLLAAMPKLNPDQQAEAAQHIANLSDDALAAQWSQKMIVQSLPQPATEVLFNDLLNRPHELLLPFLSKLADMPQHPQSTQSVEILEVLFGQPPAGTKWEKWVKIKAEE